MRALRTAARRRPARRGPALRLPFAAHIALWLVLGVTVAALTAWALWLLLGQPALRPANSGPASTQDKFDGLKIALTVVGGIGGVIALTVAYRKQRLGEAAERREDTKVFAERFGKASELIGSSQAAVRLSGIYAMAALADDWDDHRQTCIDVLCAYLRMPYDPPTTTPPPPPPGNRGLGLRKPHPRRATTHPVPTPPAAAPTEDPREEQQVRHTVIRVIAAHLRPESPVSWNGHTFDFTGATLDGGDLNRIDIGPDTTMIFRNATFAGGQVNFADATFSGGHVDFGGTFSGSQVNFRGATFSDGWVDFEHATFSSGQVDFGYATFSGGHVDFRGTFSGGQVDFGGARFSDGQVDFRGATFSDGRANFGYAAFLGGQVDFWGATFSGGQVDFGYATFLGGQVNFSGATFSDGEVSFGGATFSGGHVGFGGATFSGGQVDISTPSVFDVPPHFDELSDEASRWLRLPTPASPTVATRLHRTRGGDE
ncbi:pentapeptide repeat-containing protein [Actinosynnema sp. CA-248983]